MQLAVVKKSGVIEPFNRDKLVRGVRDACKGRPVSDADLIRLGQQVEDALRASGVCEVPSEDIGVAVLKPLEKLDPVAYLRFASVYLHWQSPDDFYTEIIRLRDTAMPDVVTSITPVAGCDEATPANNLRLVPSN
jgi:transcriptional repressor NrdR